jgi:hypothetical protein
MEAFWSFAKRRCVGFNGLRGDVFLLRVKEGRFRYDGRGENLLSLSIKEKMLGESQT